MTTPNERDREVAAKLLNQKDWADATDYRNTGAQDRAAAATLSVVASYRAQIERDVIARAVIAAQVAAVKGTGA